MKTTCMFLGAMMLAGSVLLMAQETNQTNIVTEYDYLKEPKISTKNNERMLVVEAKGDPNVVGSKAFGLLFQLYYTMKETPKGPTQPAPRARWPVSFNTTQSIGLGLYGLPVPENVTSLPQYTADQDLKVSLTQWKYGLVAEMLHVGSYAKEEAALKRLKEFIQQQGYATTGGHEEEYIVGPGMSGQGDSEKNVTILRYRLRPGSGAKK